MCDAVYHCLRLLCKTEANHYVKYVCERKCLDARLPKTLCLQLLQHVAPNLFPSQGTQQEKALSATI